MARRRGEYSWQAVVVRALHSKGASTLLIVRSIISIGNYDYVQDATFFLDGKLK